MNPKLPERIFYGVCNCNWVGPDRKVDSDAKADLEQHYAQTGHSDSRVDLMPHER